jgi:hypothetical protein
MIKKTKNKRHFWQVVGVAFLLPIVFSLFDLWGAVMWRLLGGWEGAAYVTAQGVYQSMFWTSMHVFALFVALTYYLITKDKSESIVLVAIPIILLQFGAADVFFYFFGGHELWTVTLPWLMHNLWGPTLITYAFGLKMITGPILLLSATIGYGISYLLARKLVKIKP